MMSKKSPISTAVIKRTEEYAHEQLEHDTSGHNWDHIQRVRKMGQIIAKQEKIDPRLVDMIALLHEMTDRKIAGRGNEKQAALATQEWLLAQNLPQEIVEEIIYVIENQSFSKSGLSGEKLISRAGQVLQDADRLDALGAIGIGRAFIYAGHHGRSMHIPSRKIRKRLTTEEYQKDDDTVIQHFHEKLFKLAGMMNTKTGKRLAKKRHQFMEKFLNEFLLEWDSKR